MAGVSQIDHFVAYILPPAHTKSIEVGVHVESHRLLSWVSIWISSSPFPLLDYRTLSKKISALSVGVISTCDGGPNWR